MSRSLWSKKFLVLAAGLAAVSMFAMACSDDDDGEDGGDSTPAATSAATQPSGGGEIDYESLSGEIRDRRLVDRVPDLRGGGRGVQCCGLGRPGERRVLGHRRRLREVLPRRDRG